MVADAQSGVTLRIEFQRGKLVHAKQKWFSEFGHMIAQSMRLTEPWHGSNRAYAADSWFGSVTAKEVLSEVGAHMAHACTYVHTYVHTYVRTYVLVRTYVHTYIHTYIHTQMYEIGERD